MARDPDIEARLRRWAEAVTTGDGSGYPVTNVLHENWSPPSPGLTPTLKVSAHSDVRTTHAMLARLSVRLRNTVVVHYVIHPAIETQCLILGCAASTLHKRIEDVHVFIARECCNMEKTG